MMWLVSEGMWPCALPRRRGRTPSAEMVLREVRQAQPKPRWSSPARRSQARGQEAGRTVGKLPCLGLARPRSRPSAAPVLPAKCAKAAGAAKSSRHTCPGPRGQARRPRSDSGTGHSFRASPRCLASWLLSSTHSCDPRSLKDSSKDGAWLSSSPSPSSPATSTAAPCECRRWCLTQRSTNPGILPRRRRRGPQAVARHVTLSRLHAT